MIIGIDGNEANVSKKVGISEYVFELIKQLKAHESPSNSFHIYLKNQHNKDFPSTSQNWKYKIFGPKKLWTQFALPLHLFLGKSKPDVFFSPAHYAPRFSAMPSVISIMDLAFFHFPEMFTRKDLTQLKSWTEYSVKKAKAIITISEATKSDIIKLYGISERKIHVVYPGIKPSITLTPHIYPMSELASKYDITDNYLLFVGTLQPRKNITRSIEAFAKLLEEKEYKDSNLQFVIIGKKGWQYEEILSAPKRFGIEDRVKFLDFVPDEDLSLFYKGAKAFIWPSLYEGFGLPILEAMQNEVPVITSNVSSLPEAGGDAALYVDPEKVDEITKAMKKILEDKELRKELIEKGKKQVTKFSWEKAGEETLQVLQEVANSK